MTILSPKLNKCLVGLSLVTVSLTASPLEAMGGTGAQVPTLSNSAKSTILKEHNKYRAAVNSPALQWSSDLEQDAKQWAAHLAAMGGNKLVHADKETRNGQGENLWMGAAGYFSYNQMVQTWANEKKYFKAGVFPNVSQTGNGYNVSHYTQVVWKNTTKIGCAQARAGGNDLLVCRYDPAGNILGQSVF